MTSARARLRDWFDDIARSITQYRRARPREGGQHQFAGLPCGYGLAARRLDDLWEISRFDYMEHSWTRRTFVSDWTGLSHAVMITNARPVPQLGQAGAKRRNAAARFTRDDNRPH